MIDAKEFLEEINELDAEVMRMLRRGYELKRMVDKRIADYISKK